MLVRWIDRQIAKNDFTAKNLMLFLVAGGILLLMLIGWNVVTITLAIAWSLFWVVIFALRWGAVYGAKGDERYDKLIRHKLPPEYSDTESATKAAWRRSRQASRKTPKAK